VRSIPVDVARISLAMVMTDPARATDMDGRPRADREGLALYQTDVAVAVSGGGASVIRVRTRGEPPRVAQGMLARIGGLTATPWEIEGRSGITYDAEALTAAPTPTAPAGPAPAAPVPAGGPAGPPPAPAGAGAPGGPGPGGRPAGRGQ
jgi:hypothetical protein